MRVLIINGTFTVARLRTNDPLYRTNVKHCGIMLCLSAPIVYDVISAEYESDYNETVTF